MKTLFDPVRLGRVTVKNRICRSATEDGMCRDGRATPELYAVYERLAAGGAGLVCSGMREVSPTGLYVPSAAVAWHEDLAEELRPTAEAMHENGAVFVVQLVHSGFKARAVPNPLYAPSDYSGVPGVEAREMTREQIRAVTADFAAAARRVRDSGADGVQLHNAHVYLLSEFFSPCTNRRTDEYGGSTENRARFALEVYEAVREAVGDDFIIGIKTNCSDMIEPTISFDECAWLVQTLRERGLDYVELSGGLIPGAEWHGSLDYPPGEGEPPFYASAAELARRVDIPVYSVAGWRDPELMERCLNESGITGISMAMPFIREPDLPNRWLSGDRNPAKCITCHACGRGSGYAVMCQPKPANADSMGRVECVFNRGKAVE